MPHEARWQVRIGGKQARGTRRRGIGPSVPSRLDDRPPVVRARPGNLLRQCRQGTLRHLVVGDEGSLADGRIQQAIKTSLGKSHQIKIGSGCTQAPQAGLTLGNGYL
ncbi:hypothetical protein TW95_gp0394 [Pandoravirus inopinatum]|uniref:Uncharacterized protein n=1 Tax=Pandoravirus inopinatum TaxID=1605721 RepID=A0A0B5IWQ1_9VIRU|nr:hypothetical protein TW95_gp0394 [Pandoravirus inopinatum]AJF97128.1 hypothetical protein [Pandoravirus inopinatum]